MVNKIFNILKNNCFKDMVERFQIFIFLMIITLQNFSDLEWNLTSSGVFFFFYNYV